MIIDRINERLAARQTTAAKVGDDVGSRSRVYDILSGKSANPGIETTRAIADKLGTTVAYLIGETDDPAPSAPLRATDENQRLIVRRASAGVSYALPDVDALFLSLETDEMGTQRFALSPEIAALLLEDYEAEFRRLAERRRERQAASA